MSKSRFKYKQPAHVALSWELLNSPAYKELTQSAGKALPYFLGKAKFVYTDPQRYSLIFSFPYSEAIKYGFATSTFSKVIQDLVKKGFIDPVNKGGLRSDMKSYNTFKLSRRWENYGKKQFENIEWRCFIPKTRLKATPEKEMNSSRKGNKQPPTGSTISQIGAVGAVSD